VQVLTNEELKGKKKSKRLAFLSFFTFFVKRGQGQFAKD
jgi:hypothetical protein